MAILVLSLLPIKISIPKDDNSSWWCCDEQPQTIIIALGFNLFKLRITFLDLESDWFVTEQVFTIKIFACSGILANKYPSFNRLLFITSDS